jgi:dipeptidyl-peptidase 4
MKVIRLSRWIRFLLMLGMTEFISFSQGSRSDYDRALSLAGRTEDAVFRQRIKAVWLPEGNAMWYRVATGPGTQEFVGVDALSGVRRPLFDHSRLAGMLTRLLGTNITPDRLPLDRLSIAGNALPPESLRFRIGDRRWIWSLGDGDPVADPSPEPDLPSLVGRGAPTRSRESAEETRILFRNETVEDLELFWVDTEGQRKGYGRLRAGQERTQHTFVGHVFLLTDREGSTVAVFEADADSPRAVIRPLDSLERAAVSPPDSATESPPSPGTSPDGRWVAFVQDHQLCLRDRATGAVLPLSTDGTATDAYREPVVWSPDSSHVVAARVQSGGDRKVTFLEVAPRDQVQPRVHSHPYLKPGDPLPKPRLRLFSVPGRQQFDIEDSLYPNPFTEDGDLEVRWAPDSSVFFFNYNQRGHQLYRILAVPVVHATRKDSVGALTPRVVVEEAASTFIDWTNKTWRHWLDATGEVLWLSERDGWAHLWLVDAVHGRVKQQITRGEWVVREVLQVDDTRRQIWFLAGGVRPEQDPYQLHLCRVSFDGSGFQILTEGDGDHVIEFSPDRRWFVDAWSRADLPPITELRRSEDGARVCVLEQGDASALAASGWALPERFVAMGRDGVTPVYGVLIRPSHFDSTRKYPVVEEIYAGPHGAFVPKRFGRLLRQHALAELGFVVVQVDGMGTNHRGKRFHDVAWKNLADSGLPDHIAWLKAAAAIRPWMDLSRVGIYGGSAGGQSSTRALLDHSDFYRVAVSDCGCHDNRMDKIWWNEQWLGWPVDESYLRSSNVEHAARLQGKLLLIVGELDTNVDPASTLQLAAALVRADRDFDLLVMPGANHGAAESPYGTRRRMDFFVRHLLGREPRWE